MAAAAASERSFAIKCEKYASCVQRLRQLFPWVTFRWWFVPGEKNVADGGSRGLLEAPNTDDIEIALAAAHPLIFEKKRKRAEWMR